ncbi:MAG TPA: VWA domain-containing protein [Gammaproteobacteria bacterium]|nr:VWA domain-containing protein [Gammaproteobacteria bacterium]
MESQRSAMKVWHQRQYQDYDPEVELGTRNIKMALRRLRKFARTAAEMELDLMDTIRCTARNGGFLDIREVPERHNSVKVLLFLDVGGSMDDHIELCSQLFAAARSEFKYLEYYYFHNFIYENIWLSNDRRQEEKLNTFDLIRRFGSDYKIIFVGDANMARHEIAERGGSVEHFNGDAGEVWLSRIQDQFKKIIWLNPVEKKKWRDSYTTEMIRRLVDDHMYHLSVDGIEQAMRYLAR